MVRPAAKRLPQYPEAMHLSHHSILIVDDEQGFRELLVEALRTDVIHVESAPDAETALTMAEEKHYPVILTDLNLPGNLSGLDLIRTIRTTDRRAFCIVMTGNATTEVAIQALKEGAYDFILKPFTLVEIKASLKRALSHYGTLRENESYQAQLEEMVAERTGETMKLKEDIEHLFESFVAASVTAIESRDPSTSGHSQRVAELTVSLSEAVNRTEGGHYGSTYFTDPQLREIRYASLLHDFGKVGVPEHLLLKAKKLKPERLDHLLQRLHQRDLEGSLELFEQAWESGSDFDPARLKELMDARRRESRALVERLLRCNEPQHLLQSELNELVALENLEFKHWSGKTLPLMEPGDMECLRVRKGSLTPSEREEVRSHVSHSFRFLSRIPWTGELANVPDIAYAHHERLNGQGYPRGITSGEIPVQSKIMAISDVFDALVARDRPYKRALGVEESLDILNDEARCGLLDRNLLDIFLEARVYEVTTSKSREAP
ncbi:MAG: response regulator [Holophagaceae bacterium]|nr:response regulator [Holophagaceae bacterium]